MRFEELEQLSDDQLHMLIFGPGFEIVDANDSFLNTIGYDREDLEAGRLHWTKLTPPDGLDRTVRAARAVGSR